jgi:hypothetical protein
VRAAIQVNAGPLGFGQQQFEHPRRVLIGI